MKNTTKPSVSIYIISITALALVLIGCGTRESMSPALEKKYRVNVYRVVLDDLSETLNLTGEVMPLSSVILTSKVPGRLEKLAATNEQGVYVPVTEGTHIHKGQQLAVIDYATYSARAQQAEAVLASAKAQFEHSAREEKRMTALFKEGASTEQTRDKSITARSQCEAVLKQAEASLKLARIDLDEATPDSPINGVVVSKFIDEGNIVAPGMAILTIQDISRVKVIFSVPERYINRVIPGKTRVKISSDAFADTSINSLVTRAYPAIDRATRTAKAEVLVDNNDRRTSIMRNGPVVCWFICH